MVANDVDSGCHLNQGRSRKGIQGMMYDRKLAAYNERRMAAAKNRFNAKHGKPIEPFKHANGTCEKTGKMKFKDKDMAYAALGRAIMNRVMRDHIEQRVYHCPYCDGWHLTSIGSRSSVKLTTEEMLMENRDVYDAAMTSFRSILIDEGKDSVEGAKGKIIAAMHRLLNNPNSIPSVHYRSHWLWDTIAYAIAYNAGIGSTALVQAMSDAYDDYGDSPIDNAGIAFTARFDPDIRANVQALALLMLADESSAAGRKPARFMLEAYAKALSDCAERDRWFRMGNRKEPGKTGNTRVAPVVKHADPASAKPSVFDRYRHA